MAFLWGAAGEKLTPKQASEQRKIAQALLSQASDTSPVGHWTAALNRGLQGYLGGRQSYLAREGEKLGDEHASSIYKSLPGMGGGSVASALAGGGAPVAAGGVNPVNIGGSQEEFINTLMPYALQVQEQYGIAPEITLAQAALETGWGKSAPGNNFFGIKSHGKSGGNTLATTEVINGQPVRVNDSFRAYGSPGESVLDYGRFLSENPRYKPMLAASGDLEAQIDALGKSGYATDPNYASKIRSIAYGIAGRQGSVADTASVGAAPSAGGGSAALLAAMADPHVAERYGPQIQAALGQAQARENAVFEQQLAAQDPLRQLQLEKGQLELEQLRQGKPNEYAQRASAATQFGLQEGTPEFQSFVLTGEIPASTPTKAPETNVFFDEETGQEYRAQWNPNTLTWDRIGGTKSPSGPLVSLDMGGDKFSEEVGKGQAAAFQEMSATGFTAAQNLGNLDRLESLLAQGPSGAAAALQNLAANYGIDVGNAGPLQAANALIQAMIPAQRPAGSGPMSDKDIEMFKNSLPRLINSAEGNALIVQTLRGIAQYDMERAKIADRAMLPASDPEHLPRAEATKMLRELRSPLSDFSRSASAFKEAQEDGSGATTDISKATLDDFKNVDLTKISPQERAAWVKRVRELQGGQ